MILVTCRSSGKDFNIPNMEVARDSPLLPEIVKIEIKSLIASFLFVLRQPDWVCEFESMM